MVLQKLEQGLLTITMNRPDRRNALNPDMTRGLVEAARRAAEDHEVRAVLLKGAGGTFCVGGDVKSMAEGRAPLAFEAKMANLRRGMEVSRILHQMPKPVVAQLDGAAAGAGLSIALSCDLRVASASCKITTAFAKVGLSGDYGGTYFLTQMLGSAKARELYLTSPVLSATEAYNLGMVTKVVPDADIDAEAHDLAMSLAQGPSVTLGYIKRNINNAETMSLEACFDAEAIHHSRSGETADHKEAAKAFVEKRKPAFAGGIEMAEYLQAAADLPGGAASGARDLGYLRDHGPQCLLPRRQRREIRAGERAAAGRHHPAGSGGADAAGYGRRALSRQDRRPRRLHGDLLLRRSRRARQARQRHGRAHRERDHARALSRRATASARLPRRLHRVQPHRQAATTCWGPIRRPGRIGRKSIRKDVTLALTDVEMQSPDPQGLAEHWGKIAGVAVSKDANGDPELKLPNASFRFVKGASDLMSGLTFRVADIAKVRDAAKAKGCKVSGDTFDLCGVTFRLVA